MLLKDEANGKCLLRSISKNLSDPRIVLWRAYVYLGECNFLKENHAFDHQIHCFSSLLPSPPNVLTPNTNSIDLNDELTVLVILQKQKYMSTNQCIHVMFPFLRWCFLSFVTW